MFKRLQSLFSGKRTPKPTVTQIIMPAEVVEALTGSGDILRYPPAELGFPAQVPGFALLSLQDEILSKIKRELMIRDAEYDEYIQPMLTNFANFVHLLPASEFHHHRAQGGLLRHTLEVVLYSIKIAKSFEFDANESPVIKSDRALAWRIAVVVGAVMHDIGKPISDVDVWDKSGEKHWMPAVHCLHEWAETEKVERYFIFWRTDRHERHHNTSLTKMTDIVPKSLLAFLMQEGNDIYNELTEALAGSNSFRAVTSRNETGTVFKNKIHKIVSHADSRSVKQDLQRYSGDAVRAAQTGVPVIARIVDAMRLLIKKEEWKPNLAGSPLWVTTEGVFIVWGTAVTPIINIVKESGINVPHSADSLADIMLNYGLCVLNSNDSVYWRLAPHILNDKISRENKEPKNALSCIKLIDPVVLFTDDVIPNPTSCRIKLADGWKEFTGAGLTKQKSQPSRPYVGEKPPERVLNVDPDILKGGSLPPTDDLPPDGTVVKRGTVIEQKNIVDHMLRMNLLSPENAAAIKSRNENEAKAKSEAQAVEANPKPAEAEAPAKGKGKGKGKAAPAPAPAELSDKKSRPQNKKTEQTTAPVAEKSEPVRTEDQGELFDTESRYSDYPHVDTDAEDDTYDLMDQYNNQPQTEAPLTLQERMARAAIQKQYEDDEGKINQGDAPKESSWEKARAKIRQAQDVSDGHAVPSDTHSHTESADDSAFIDNDHHFSVMFRDGPDEAKQILKRLVKERAGELLADNYHLFIHNKDEQDEHDYTVLVNAGWVWKPFLEPMDNFQLYKSKPGFLLRRGLNEDIDYLSGGTYLKSIYPVDPNNSYCADSALYRAIASYGLLKQTYDNKDVIAISGSAIRNMSKSLRVDTATVRFLICYNFDSVNRRGSEHVLVDENIKPYMVDSHE